MHKASFNIGALGSDIRLTCPGRAGVGVMKVRKSTAHMLLFACCYWIPLRQYSVKEPAIGLPSSMIFDWNPVLHRIACVDWLITLRELGCSIQDHVGGNDCLCQPYPKSGDLSLHVKAEAVGR